MRTIVNLFSPLIRSAFAALAGCLSLSLSAALVAAAPQNAGVAIANPFPTPSILPFDPLPNAQLRALPRKVFAHYFTPFPMSMDNQPRPDIYDKWYLQGGKLYDYDGAYGPMLRERPLPRAARSGSDWMQQDVRDQVRMGSALGLDGFICDILGYEGVWYQRVVDVMDAAQTVDPSFKIMLMPDMDACFKNHPEKLTDVVLALAKHPAAYRLADGRLVVSPFDASQLPASFWRSWLAEMKAKGCDIAFVPLNLSWQHYAPDFAPISEGLADWGARSPDNCAKCRDDAATAHRSTKIWMAAVNPQDFRPKAGMFAEANGSEQYRLMWDNAIEGGADWAQIVTWSDYGEGTELEPSTGTQYGYYDLTAYYLNWFKTGAPPAIKRDVLYYFHRVQSAYAVPDQSKQARLFHTFPWPGTVPNDHIELLAFLTAPGQLEIENGGKKFSKDAPAGVTSFTIPLVAGTPVFRLRRNGNVVTEVTSTFPIVDKIVTQDLLYRAGSSSRPPVQGVDGGPGAK
ncbi:MAG: glycoside hydrolase family 71 protein [Capsulimonadaceae bacterium]|nr:glycoside hydrolase family 71 protein [Capsulimonadaceae bacterium]